MPEKVQARLKVPSSAKKGEIVEIKTLIFHPMDSGQARDLNGKIIPREIINTFTCQYNGKQVFKMKLEPAIASNPFIVFNLRVEESGTLDFTWLDDNGSTYKEQAKIVVS
jgi:sulfur-oxidizing protein SoxZ